MKTTASLIWLIILLVFKVSFIGYFAEALICNFFDSKMRTMKAINPEEKKKTESLSTKIIELLNGVLLETYDMLSEHWEENKFCLNSKVYRIGHIKRPTHVNTSFSIFKNHCQD